MTGIAEPGDAVAKGDHRHRRRHGEAQPRREGAGQAGAEQAQRDADLAAGRPRQKLAERDDIDIAALVEPFAARDELGAEISEMRHRAAEARHAQPQEGQQHLERRAAPLSGDRDGFAHDISVRRMALEVTHR